MSPILIKNFLKYGINIEFGLKSRLHLGMESRMRGKINVAVPPKHNKVNRNVEPLSTRSNEGQSSVNNKNRRNIQSVKLTI